MFQLELVQTSFFRKLIKTAHELVEKYGTSRASSATIMKLLGTLDICNLDSNICLTNIGSNELFWQAHKKSS